MTPVALDSTLFQVGKAATSFLHPRGEAPTEGGSGRGYLRYGAVAVLLSTLAVPQIVPASNIETETARPYGKTIAYNQRLNIDRTDLRLLERVRQLALYQDGWDGRLAKAISKHALDDAENFILSLPDNIHPAHLSIATDGEINFLWVTSEFRLDLGFYGDGSYSYYGRTNAKEFISDSRPADKGLPKEIIKLLKRDIAK